MSLSQQFASVGYKRNVHYVMYVMLQQDAFESVHSVIVIISCPLTARVVGAPQIIWQPHSSIFPVMSASLRTPVLSISWCCVRSSSSVCLVFFPLSRGLAILFWPNLINNAYILTKSVLPATRLLENFLLQSPLCVVTLIPCPFQPRITVVPPKSPRSFCQKYSWQITSKHAYTLFPPWWECAEYATVQAECGNLSEKELTLNSSGNNPSQSSHLTGPLWTDPGLISVRELISTLNQTKTRRCGINCRLFSQSHCKRGKRHQLTPTG